jgi:predicted HTH domain antitoxin
MMMDKKVSRIYTKIITRCFGCRSAHAGYGSGIYHCAITGTELKDINTLPNDCPIPSFNLTEGDLVGKIVDELQEWKMGIVRMTRHEDVTLPNSAKEEANVILSLISPQLLKKNEEIERLKETIKFFLKKSDLDVYQAVQQAKQDERERIEIQHIDAINDYVKGKISFERCAEILDINFYELAEFCTVRRQALQGER